MEEWKKVLLFTGYSVSNLGRVRNDKTGRMMTIMRNHGGVCYVGLARSGKQCRRSVAPLVAQAFVPKPGLYRESNFSDLIHLDGDSTNNKSTNLMWRPHWFAMRYWAQFKTGPTVAKPVIEKKTNEQYPRPWDAAVVLGLLEREIIDAALNRTFVWPTYQEFRFAE